jgi:hypothetical protein
LIRLHGVEKKAQAAAALAHKHAGDVMLNGQAEAEALMAMGVIAAPEGNKEERHAFAYEQHQQMDHQVVTHHLAAPEAAAHQHSRQVRGVQRNGWMETYIAMAGRTDKTQQAIDARALSVLASFIPAPAAAGAAAPDGVQAAGVHAEAADDVPRPNGQPVITTVGPPRSAAIGDAVAERTSAQQRLPGLHLGRRRPG